MNTFCSDLPTLSAHLPTESARFAAMTTLIHRLVDACRAGAAPQVIARLPSGWAVMGTQQVLPGYSLLLPDPVVPHLNSLDSLARDRFMTDLARLGSAVLGATGAVRINYAIFGNLEPALHAHAHPRYADEPPAMRTANPWAYDWSLAPPFDANLHGSLRDSIRDRLSETGIDRPAPPAGRLHHIGLTVASLERSTPFYDRWLVAMGFTRIGDQPEGPIWRSARFEFGLQQAAASPTSRSHDRRVVGLHHIAFAAEAPADVERLYAQLSAADVVILAAPADYPRHAAGYFAVCFADPDGIKLEFVFTPD